MPDYDELRTLIANHLEDLENNRLPLISKKTGLSIEKIQEVWHELRKLKPKPGADFTETTVPSVTPDVFVERNDEGKYRGAARRRRSCRRCTSARTTASCCATKARTPRRASTSSERSTRPSG